MSKQAAKVMLLCHYRSAIHMASWRTVQVSLEKYGFAHKLAAIHALDALEQEVIDAQRADARPKPHRYELARAGN